MPGCVFKWGIDKTPGTGVINEYHQANSGSAEDIEGVKTLIHNKSFGH